MACLQKALTVGKTSKSALQQAVGKLLESHRQLGRYLGDLDLTPPAGDVREIVTPANVDWRNVANPPKRVESVTRPSASTDSIPTVQPVPQPATLGNETINQLQRFPSGFDPAF